jgi:predicted amidohydrolase
MERLDDFELEVLENLPVDPIGLSLAELAEGLLDDCSPAAKGKVRRALDRVAEVLNGLHVRTGNDDLGGFGVKMYGICRRRMPAVRRFFAEKQLVHV